MSADTCRYYCGACGTGFDATHDCDLAPDDAPVLTAAEMLAEHTGHAPPVEPPPGVGMSPHQHRRGKPMPPLAIIQEGSREARMPVARQAGTKAADYRNAGYVRARCWCERTEVWVTLDDVRYGRTGSCGTVTCERTAARFRRARARR